MAITWMEHRISLKESGCQRQTPPGLMSKDADLTEVGGRTVVTKATVVDEEVNEGMLVKRYIISERISQETC